MADRVVVIVCALAAASWISFELGYVVGLRDASPVCEITCTGGK